MRNLILLLLLFLTAELQAQQNFTINGYIRDATTGEELPGVNLFLMASGTGTTTNAYGFYALTLSPGTYEIRVSFVGYKTLIISRNLTSDVSFNIEMEPESQMIDEVTVTATRPDDNLINSQMSRISLSTEQLRKLPSLMGEADLIKAIQQSPGVVSAGEGTSSFFVRGGSGDQNLILIDEAPVYDPSHLFGLISVFNSDVIKDFDLYKGGVPARFGGRLSGILDVRTRDGNNRHQEWKGGVGTLAARLVAEGPLVKEKSSYIVSARRSFADVFMRMANQDNLVHFYDVNAKINWRGNDKNRFFAAYYAGRDVFQLDKSFGFGFGNQTATLRWNHLFNQRMFSNITVIGSKFDYNLELKEDFAGFRWISSLVEGSVKADLSYALTNRHELTFGYQLTLRSFAPGNISPRATNSIFTETKFPLMHARDHAWYLADAFTVNDKWLLEYGLRVSLFENTGKGDVLLYEDPQDNVNPVITDTLHFRAGEVIKAYLQPEPRFSARYRISEVASMKASYQRMVQNTHLISLATVPLPFNTWNPSNYYLKPQIANQVALGYFHNLRNNTIEVSAEGFYKSMQQVTDFADNAEVFFNPDLSTEYRQGKSWAYGAEFSLVKKTGKFTGMLGYTWSKAERKIPGVNHGRTFAANHDRRHVLNLQGVYEMSSRWTLAAAFNYSSGRPITLPDGKYEYGPWLPDNLTVRNGYRLPDFHRLDISATYRPRRNDTRRMKGEWVFSVYNVYNRKNPFSIFTQTRKDASGEPLGDGSKEAKLIYLFPILPTITYNFKF